jgi:uncharacterized protein
MTTNTQTQWRTRYGPWAVITGASDGIGREMAQCAAAAGLHVVLVARRGALLTQLADELRARHQVETLVLPCDLAAPDGAAQVLKATEALDVGLLVACAGFGTAGEFLKSPLADEWAMFNVNCGAVLTLTHGFGGRMVQRGRGGLVLMSSLLAFQGVPRAAHYAATKAYIQSLAEGLRHELKPLGVDVIASAPGPIFSGFATRANMQMSIGDKPYAVAQETLDALGRWDTVRPGTLSKLLELAMITLPRWIRVQLMARIMGGMTAHRA